jgi:hypothetical protein
MDAGGFEQRSVNGNAPFVIQVGAGNRGAVNLGLQ